MAQEYDALPGAGFEPTAPAGTAVEIIIPQIKYSPHKSTQRKERYLQHNPQIYVI